MLNRCESLDPLSKKRRKALQLPRLNTKIKEERRLESVASEDKIRLDYTCVMYLAWSCFRSSVDLRVDFELLSCCDFLELFSESWMASLTVHLHNQTAISSHSTLQLNIRPSMHLWYVSDFTGTAIIHDACSRSLAPVFKCFDSRPLIYTHAYHP